MAGSNKFSLASRHQLAMGGNKFMSAISDDNAMMKQITAIHDPDDRDVDTRTLLRLVENILKRATLAVDDATGSQEQLESLEETCTHQAGFTTMLEALSSNLNPPMIWFFWARIESMLLSKIQLGKADDRDPLMQEVKKLLSYDKEGGWAVLSKGSSVILNGHSTTVLPTLENYDSWKEEAADKGFDVAFKNHHDELQGVTHPCCRFEFPHTTGRIPENFKCPECDRQMEKLTTFLCCHDEKSNE